MYLCLMVVTFVLVMFIAGLERLVPYDVPPTPAPVVTPAPPKPPADECIATANGNPCVPMNKIFQMMDENPDPPQVVPPNPAAKNLERI